MKKDVLLIIPAYNEEKSIGKVMTDILESGIEDFADILVIDDGSKDNTAKVVQEKKVKVISQIYNMGYGAALQTGYKYAVNQDYSYLIQMDADGQHDLKNVFRIYKALLENNDTPYDIIIGSRYLETQVKYNMSPLRLFAIGMFRVIIKLTTGQAITDPTSGMQGLSRRAFSYYAGYANFDIKYPDINMILQMLFLGFRVKEVPAIMYERKEGEAMHSGILKPFVYMLLMSISTTNVMIRFYGKKKLDRRKNGQKD